MREKTNNAPLVLLLKFARNSRVVLCYFVSKKKNLLIGLCSQLIIKSFFFFLVFRLNRLNNLDGSLFNIKRWLIKLANACEEPNLILKLKIVVLVLEQCFEDYLSFSKCCAISIFMLKTILLTITYLLISCLFAYFVSESRQKINNDS